MSRIVPLKPSEVIRKLRRAGFIFDRHAKGSHEIWWNPNTHCRTVVPNHPGKDIPMGTLREIVRAAGITQASAKSVFKSQKWAWGINCPVVAGLSSVITSPDDELVFYRCCAVIMSSR